MDTSRKKIVPIDYGGKRATLGRKPGQTGLSVPQGWPGRSHFIAQDAIGNFEL